MARVYRIDLQTQAVYEAGATLLVLLAFPKETADDKVFGQLHAALCMNALIQRAQNDREWAFAHQEIRPAHFSLPPGFVKKKLRKLERCLRDRMIAGRIANAIIFDAAGLRPTLPKGCEGFSIEQLIKLALDDLDQVDARNAAQRVWRESLPVIHLAAAVQAYLNQSEKAPYEVSPGDIIFDPNAILWITHRAIQTAQLMLDHGDRFRLGKRHPVVIQTAAPIFTKITTS